MVERLSRAALAALLLLGALLVVLMAAGALFAAVYMFLAARLSPELAALIGAGLLLLIAVLLAGGALLLARGPAARTASPEAAQAGADPMLELGRLGGKLAREHAPEATAMAFGIGLLLGLKPELREQLLRAAKR